MKQLPFLLLLVLLGGCSPSPRKLQLFADDYVKERQEKWKGRVAQVSTLSKGTPETDILKQLGKPDVTSDSATAKNWLYWITANLQNGQICMDCLILKIENGVVTELKQNTTREMIADVYQKKHK